MLVITRRLDEEIVIGDAIRLKVVDIAGNRIRLGITAPREVAIRREGLDSQGALRMTDLGPGATRVRV
jgi:carbon storage regulator